MPLRPGHRRIALAPAVLALVASAALVGCGGDGGDGGGGEGGGAAAAGSDLPSLDADVVLVGRDELAYSETEVTAAAGELRFGIICEDAVNHNIVIEEADDTLVAECDAGETGTGSIELDPGDYTFYCDVPGHRTAGMEGTLTVEG